MQLGTGQAEGVDHFHQAVHRGITGVVHLQRDVAAIARHERGKTYPELRRHYAAVTSAGAPGQGIGLDDEGLAATAGDMMGCREAGVTRTDDHHVALPLAFQGLQRGCRLGGGRP
ncbi:hypothetical protein D3C76_1574730 [compost metagenome]